MIFSFLSGGTLWVAVRISTSSPVWFVAFGNPTLMLAFIWLFSPNHTPLPTLELSMPLFDDELSVYAVISWSLFCSPPVLWWHISGSFLNILFLSLAKTLITWSISSGSVIDRLKVISSFFSFALLFFHFLLGMSDRPSLSGRKSGVNLWKRSDFRSVAVLQHWLRSLYSLSWSFLYGGHLQFFLLVCLTKVPFTMWVCVGHLAMSITLSTIITPWVSLRQSLWQDFVGLSASTVMPMWNHIGSLSLRPRGSFQVWILKLCFLAVLIKSARQSGRLCCPLGFTFHDWMKVFSLVYGAVFMLLALAAFVSRSPAMYAHIGLCLESLRYLCSHIIFIALFLALTSSSFVPCFNIQ